MVHFQELDPRVDIRRANLRFLTDPEFLSVMIAVISARSFSRA